MTLSVSAVADDFVTLPGEEMERPERTNKDVSKPYEFSNADYRYLIEVANDPINGIQILKTSLDGVMAEPLIELNQSENLDNAQLSDNNDVIYNTDLEQDEFSTLQQVIAYFDSIKDETELAQNDNKEEFDGTSIKGVPKSDGKYIHDYFRDVMTYQEERRQMLKEALL
jgi:hypothetical protein